MSWGLRRYAWVVVLFVLALGALVPALQSRIPEVYEARAQVGPSEVLALPNVDPLPRLGETVFANGAVEKVIRSYLQLPRSATIVPDRVELLAAQDNIVFIVVGRASDPEVARDLADIGATTFTSELNKYSRAVTQFTIQRSAEVPSRPEPSLRGGYIAVALGILAGLITGVGAVAFLVVMRRPVVEAAIAEEATGLPVLGRLRLPRRSGKLDHSGQVGVALLCRQLLTGGHKIVWLATTSHGQAHLQRLQEAMQEVLGSGAPGSSGSSGASGQPSNVRKGHGRQQSPPHPGRAPESPKIQVIDGPSLSRWARRGENDGFVLLVVPVGESMRALRSATDTYASGQPAGLAMLSLHGRRAAWRPRLQVRQRGTALASTAD